MGFVLMSWVLFRAANFGVAGSVLMSMVGAGGVAGALQSVKLLITAGLACVLIPSAHEIIDGFKVPHPVIAAAGALLAVYCLFEAGGGAAVQFIYFQF
jgi:alginate O-acetyltransferase complex protein AlgI